LSPDTVIVRGGESTILTLRRNAEDTHLDEGVWGISGWAAVDMPVGELLDQLASVMPHSKLRVTTVGRLESAGYRVELTGPPLHVTIRLRGGLSADNNDELEVLAALFDPPVSRDRFRD
jgi:hypothetical protein